MRAIIKVKGHQHQWLAGGYDLEIEQFLEVASMVVSWSVVAFLPSERYICIVSPSMTHLSTVLTIHAHNNCSDQSVSGDIAYYNNNVFFSNGSLRHSSNCFSL